jgi:dephospho-CoA kinase
MIFLAGYHCAGKTESIAILRSWEFDSIDLGPALREHHRSLETGLPFHKWHQIESARDPHFADDILAGKVEAALKSAYAKSAAEFVIAGSRSWGGMEYLKGRVSPLLPYQDRQIVVRIDAPYELLMERYLRRSGVGASKEKFRELIAEDKALGIETIIGKEDLLINNAGSRDELSAELARLRDWAMEPLTLARSRS